MGMQNGSKLEIWPEKILIHTLELKIWHFEVLLYYVCIESRIHIFAHKNIYGCAAYVDDPLPNIVYTAVSMPACIV
jgi:hypothetical protein